MTPTQEAEAHRLAADGQSHRAIGKALGVSHTLVGQVLRRPLREVPTPQQAKSAVSHESALDRTRRLIDDVREVLDEARASGDARAFQLHSRTLAALMPTLSREETKATEGDGARRWSNEDLARASALTTERVRKLCDRPLMCSQCNRALSVVYGLGVEGALAAAERGEINVQDDQ